MILEIQNAFNVCAQSAVIMSPTCRTTSTADITTWEQWAKQNVVVRAKLQVFGEEKEEGTSRANWCVQPEAQCNCESSVKLA